MKINTFKIEHWMNLYEIEAVYNIAETCVDSITVDELIAIDGTDPQEFFKEIGQKRLTYGHIEGSPEFKQLVSSLYENAEPENVLVMNGAIGANFLVLYSLVQPGDHVITIDPTYQQLQEVPLSFGANVDLLTLKEKNNYLPDLNELKSLVNEKTKLIIINNPNNPTGALIERSMLEQIVEIARKCDAYILCDEVYRNLIQDETLKVPSIVDIYEKGISTSSMSKVFSLAGLRLGWLVGPKDVIAECFKHRDYTTISVGMLDDILAVHALKNADKILERSRKIIRDNLAILDEWVAKEEAISYVKPKAGTTAMLKYNFDISSEEFCIRLFKANGAFLSPGSCFNMEGYLRIGYACDTEVLKQGLEKVSEFMKTLPVAVK
ncbi:aspartate/methionine/tyrosine aminotransferase [Lysinibacillus composti]|uniref:Aminotransferase n=1 Tax=Lysinibacillus composti TaxID=720633 RepID=A0A3N9UAY9_9BACI|nr:aminotransferase [Lysinibacillus composti]MBM7609808.1 aspartate/methionine/tyrosine aminotransferase [Lysinibacillus composti]RQW73581.1 aminotransferase [Lysinibacillus composti]